MNADRSQDLLARILDGQAPCFALLSRTGGGRHATIDVLAGEPSYPQLLADLPLQSPNGHLRGPHEELLVLIPYRQLRERGFESHDDQSPLVAVTITEHETVTVAQMLTRIPDATTRLSDRRFDEQDAQYAQRVQRVVADEIGAGAGSNFVIKRTLLGEIENYSLSKALAIFRRLLQQEVGAYWTFLVHTGEHTLLGATPERHLTLTAGKATMNPISGTYRYPQSGPTLDGLSAFLEDRKESEELYMVLDEELKMMARICDSGGQVTGPHLREMARLAHTEYFIEGHTTRDVRDLLRETMFAPTVTGSPLESATRVIARHETDGRSYYGGIAALIGTDQKAERTLDSAILIRTAEVDARGRVRIGVGSTLVRHSDPTSETLETRAKVAGLLGALEAPDPIRLGQHPLVKEALCRRNQGLADFWLQPQSSRDRVLPLLRGCRALIIDAEDNFTAMMAHQLSSLGILQETRGVHDAVDLTRFDVALMGPGPGDPRDTHEIRIERIRTLLQLLLRDRRPFVAVCLSHQILAGLLGLPLVQRAVPNQGVQGEIDLFGLRERVGFYNTYAARATEDEIEIDGVGNIRVSRDPVSGEVHALRGPSFSSMQFHAESILTVQGPRILAEAVMHALHGDQSLATYPGAISAPRARPELAP